jgi:dipeptidyl-peptidase 4
MRRAPHFVWIALTLALPASGRQITFADLTATPPLGASRLIELAWVPGGHRFSYLQASDPKSPAALDLWVEDAEGGTRRRIIAASAVPGGSPGVSPASSPLRGYEWSPDGRAVLYSRDGNLWLYRPDSAAFAEQTRGGGEKEFPTFSPDGRRIAYVEKNDLWVLEISTGRVTRLSTDGTEAVFNGRLDWVYEEELASRSGRSYVWSPDSRCLAYLHIDDSGVPSYPIVDYLPTHATANPQHYPQPGDPNPRAAVRVVDVSARLLRQEVLPADTYAVPDLAFTPDSAAVVFPLLGRDQTHLALTRLSLADGASRSIAEESDRYWLNVSNFAAGPPKYGMPLFLRDGNFLWSSERTGFFHIYRTDPRDGTSRALTSGEWMVDFLCGIDERGGWAYVVSTRGDPRRRELARVRLDGSGFQPLSREPGTHRAELSPDGAFLLDRFSTVSRPTETRVLDARGAVRRVVEAASRDLEGVELAATEWMDVTAQDGTVLHGRLVRPPGFDPARRYPVIVDVYGGPQAQTVTDAWGTTSLFDHYLAQRGYLVWQLDNRGSWGRGHAFETPVFRDLGRVELEDQLAGVEALRKLPYVDAARLAMWGWSYGGYMTLYAISHSPATWKCAVAGAPVTDWRLYDSTYTERYMGTPVENPDGYDRSSPARAARDIRARLLLLQGAADDNVHPQNLFTMIDGLTKAGVSYDLQIQLGQKHGFRGVGPREYMFRRIVDFFEHNL